MKKIFWFVCVCWGVALLTSCGAFNSREVTVSHNDSLRSVQAYFRAELINPNGLALESENFLRGNLMQDDLKENPLLVLKKLNEFYKLSNDEKYLLIATDMCRYLATQERDSKAVCCNLSSLYYGTSYFRVWNAKMQERDLNPSALSLDATPMQCLQDYNEACCGIFSFLKKRNLLNSDSCTLHDMEGHEYVMEKPIYRLSVSPDDIEELSLCASYSIENLRQVNRQVGLGVPLVAKLKNPKKKSEKGSDGSALRMPEGLTIPVTLLVVRKDMADGKIALQCIFIDANVQETIQIQSKLPYQIDFPLTLDFSTPLAYFLSNCAQKNLLSLMLNAFEQEATDGLYMIEPYQPNKIPVVFIHGLMSSPETWMQMINSLKNDPTIRKRYQFWFFSYSTGAPVAYSAKKLRTALLAAQKEFCTTPEATENFNNMVLVGHSMGGLLTRMMIQKDPHAIAEEIFGMPFDQIKGKLKPDEFEHFDSYMPYSLPFVHRVVFMAVPHRGADMAKSPIANFGISIVKLPATILNQWEINARILRTLKPQIFIVQRNRFLTGIDGLNPDNGFVIALGKSKMRDDVVYHCIIGNKSEEGVPGASDGVVPYWSSHLDGAASELVVKSGHSVHRHPMAIQELLRILLLHQKETDKEATQK